MEQKLKNNIDLVRYCEQQLGKPYWYGTFGQMSTMVLYNVKKKQYPKYYIAEDFQDQLGIKVHDCVGLIKGYFWCKDPEDIKPVYCSNNFPDISANSLYVYCKRRSSDIKKMPDVPGIAVFMSGHVGVYVGNGEVIEARGHAYGVVRTKLNERPWRKWAYIEGLQYLIKKQENKEISGERKVER